MTFFIRQRLRQKLLKKAKTIHGKRDSPINVDRVFEHADLQISTEAEKDWTELDLEELAKNREMFKKNLSKQQSNMPFRNIFAEAGRVAYEQAVQLHSDEAQKTYLARHGKLVAVTGQAGIGKTTMSKLVVKLKAEDKQIEKRGFIFFIRLKEIDFDKPITLLQFLLTSSNLSWKHCQWFDQELLKSLGDGSNVTIVMDGLDEANTNAFMSSITRQSPFSVSTADEHIKHLLLGNVFPKSEKMITSRPRQFLDLNAELKPKFVVRVLGLSPEAQHDISTQICQGQPPEILTQTRDFLNENPHISSLCFVPALCILINFIVSRDIAENQATNIQSLTSVFVNTLKYFTSGPHFKGKRNELRMIAGLAWEGFRDGKLSFNRADFEKYGLCEKAMHDFMVPHIDREDRFQVNIHGGSVKNTFTHLAWQELFTAVHIVFFSPEEKLDEIFPYLRKNHFDVVANFVFGLTDQNNANNVFEIFNVCTENLFEQNKAKLVALTKHMASTVQKNDSDTVKIISKWLHNLQRDDVGVEIFSLLCERYLQGIVDTSNMHTLISAFKLSKQPVKICANTSGKKSRKMFKADNEQILF